MTRLLLLGLCLIAPAVYAAALDDARQALNAGQYEQALKDFNKHLSRDPRDAEARFQKGLALVMLERNEEAITVFSDLARDFPELPEPYNNLAVLYARAGQYEEAKDALEAALVSHPSYATAHENLGDIYTALARAAYNRAVVLDKTNTAVEQKLAVLAQLESGKNGAAPTKLTAPIRQAQAPAPTLSTDNTLPARPGSRPAATLPSPAAVTSAPRPSVSTPAASSAQAQATPAAARTATPMPAALPAPPAPVSGANIIGNAPVLGSTAPVVSERPSIDRTPSRPKGPDEPAILAVLDRWSSAWSTQDVDGYLSVYSPNFEPSTGVSRAVWESQRRSRVVRPSSISIQVLNPTVFQGTASFARVNFLQIYESSTYSDQVRKELELEKLNGKWLIVSERVVN